MKNVTITLDEEVAHRARIAAAKAGKSLSRWIGQTLERELGTTGNADKGPAALRRYLKGRGWPGVSTDLPTRDELHDRPALRRHKHPDSRNGSGKTGKARKSK